MNEIRVIAFKNLKTGEEKEYKAPYEMYYNEGTDTYELTTRTDGKIRHHNLSAKTWVIKYFG